MNPGPWPAGSSANSAISKHKDALKSHYKPSLAIAVLLVVAFNTVE